MHRVLESHEIQRCALRMIMHTTLNILVYLLDLMNQTPFIEIHILSAKWNWKNPAVICSWLLPKRLGFFLSQSLLIHVARLSLHNQFSLLLCQRQVCQTALVTP